MKSKYTFLIIFLIFLVSCAQQPEHIAKQASQNQMKNVDILKNGDSSNIIVENATYFENYVGFIAKPKKEGVYPAVVMIHEWWGLNDNIKEMARSLSAEGYVVLAVDLYNGKIGKNSTEAGQLASQVRNNQSTAISNMKSAVQYLRSQNNVDKEKIASMG